MIIKTKSVPIGDSESFDTPCGVTAFLAHRSALLRLICLFLVLTIAQYLQADTNSSLFKWNRKSPSTSPEVLRDLAFGNGKLVAVGDFGTVMTSDTGFQWGDAWGGTEASLHGVAFGDGKFVAVVYLEKQLSPEIMTSVDGQSWQKTSSKIPALTGDWELHSIAYGAGQFVAVGNHGVILTSQDGTTWSRRDQDAFKQSERSSLHSVAYAASHFVAVGNDAILTSVDGITWKTRTSTAELWDVACGNGTWVAVGHEGVIITSTDAMEWVVRRSGTISALDCIAFGNGVFVVGGASGKVLVSRDGVSWETIMSAVPIGRLRYLRNKFFAVGYAGTILSSEDGLKWSLVVSAVWQEFPSMTALSREPFQSVAYGAGKYVTVGCCGVYTAALSNVLSGAQTWGAVIRSSEDGKNWRDGSEDFTQTRLNDVLFDKGTFLAVGEFIIGHARMSAIVRSTDGQKWSGRYSLDGVQWFDYQAPLNNLVTRETAAEMGLNAVSSSGDKFVAVGTRGLLLTASGNSDWKVISSGTTNTLWGITWGNGQFVAVGDGGAVIRSADGVNWTSERSGLSEWLVGVAYGGGLYVAVGQNGTIITSRDGFKWTRRNSPTSEHLLSVAFGNDVFVAVGMRANFFSTTPVVLSEDGVNWGLFAPFTRAVLNAVSFLNGSFVAVGQYSGFFQSPTTPIREGAPLITRQPRSQTAMAGMDVAFTVASTGTTPLSYQWRFNGNDVPGAKYSILPLSDVRTNDTGSYVVVVSNQAGAVVSDPAVLIVKSEISLLDPPTISREQMLGEVALTEEQKAEIALFKLAILRRIATGAPLTQEEREALGRVMLMEAHLYGFTDEELDAIFAALKTQPPPPVSVKLGIRHVGPKIDLFWPTANSGFKLQQTYALSSATQWVDVNDAPTEGDNEFHMLLDAPAGTAFFRLVKR